MTYDWLAAIAFVATALVLAKGFAWAIRRVPEFERMRNENRRADRAKLERKTVRATARASLRTGLFTNLAFVGIVLPFFLSLEGRPIWQHAVEIVAVLAVFDLMYYWTHRSLFHGQLLRKVHAVHHQARKPTRIDAHYVHPLETAMGLVLFHVSIPIVSLIEGAPLNAFSAAVAMLIFTGLNQLNHVWTSLPSESRLFRTVDYITGVHRAHHVDMNHGNYATLTMFYDKLFGTFEAPVAREKA